MTVIYGIVEHGDSERPAVRARELAEEIGDAENLAELCSLHGLIISARGPAAFAAGQALVEQGLTIAERAGLPLAVVRIARALAWDYLFDGRFGDAIERIQGVLAQLERLGLGGKQRDIWLGAHFMRDRTHFHADDIDVALAGARTTYEAALTHPNRTVQSGSSVTIGLVHLVRGEHALAKEWTTRSLEVARAIGSVSHVRTAVALNVLSDHELGEPVDDDCRQELVESPPVTGVEALNCAVIVEALIAVGELKRAEHCAEHALQGAGGRFRELVCVLALAHVLIKLGPARWAEAERWLERARALAQELGSRSGLATVSLLRAELSLALDDREGALRHGEVARAAYAALGFTRYETRANRVLTDAAAASQQTA